MHPNIPITLSKIRNLKKVMLQIALDLDIELVALSKSFVYFEKLALAGLVVKQNRRLVAAACLLLACKANDDQTKIFTRLMEEYEEKLGIIRQEIVEAEFPILIALGFDLLISQREFQPHLERILGQLDYANIQEYLGERMYHKWLNNTQNK